MYKGNISTPYFNITHKFSTKSLYVHLILMRILYIPLLQCGLYEEIEFRCQFGQLTSWWILIRQFIHFMLMMG